MHGSGSFWASKSGGSVAMSLQSPRICCLRYGMGSTVVQVSQPSTNVCACPCQLAALRLTFMYFPSVRTLHRVFISVPPDSKSSDWMTAGPILRCLYQEYSVHSVCPACLFCRCGMLVIRKACKMDVRNIHLSHI